MRIRKQASKLLPLAPPPTPNHPSTLHHQNSHPHPKQQQPQPQQQQKQRHKKKDENNTHLEVSCNLNRSPWEALPLSLLLLHLDDATDDNSNSNLDVYFQQPLQDSAGEETSTIATATTAAAPSRFAGKIGSFPDPPVESKKRKNRIRYDNVDDDDDDDDDDKEDDDNCKKKMKKSDVALCKKSDGKGWNCKREAKKPYSLCDYHLSQIRSYYHGNNHPPLHQQQTKIKDDCNTAKKKKIDAGGGGGVAMVKPRRCARRSVDTGPEFYYYYSGFGPWRGKKRGGGMKEEEVGDGCGDGGVGRNNIMANGGDTCRSSSAASYHLLEDGTKEGERWGGRRGVEDDNVGIEVDPESIDDVDESSEGEDGEPSRVNWRRRARKPVKARSLKSLL